MDSRIKDIYKQPPAERLHTIADRANLSDESVSALEAVGVTTTNAESVGENVVETIEYPLSVATNFLVDGSDTLVPKAVEETSVVAADLQ